METNKKLEDIACSCKIGSKHGELFNLLRCVCNVEVEPGKWEKVEIDHVGAVAEKIEGE